MTKPEEPLKNQQRGVLSVTAAKEIAPYAFGCQMGDVLQFDQAWLREADVENAKNCICEGCEPKPSTPPEPA